jgi:hypothetical protein
MISNDARVGNSSIKNTTVKRPVSEHLDTQGKLNPRRGFHYFLCLKKIQMPLLGACDTLQIVQNILEMRSYGSQK